MSLATVAVIRLPVWRARFVLTLLVAAFLMLIARSVYLQAMRTEFLQEKGEARYARVLEVPATRGRILDRKGEALAVSTPVKSIWAMPDAVSPEPAARAALARVLGMAPADLERRIAGGEEL